MKEYLVIGSLFVFVLLAFLVKAYVFMVVWNYVAGYIGFPEISFWITLALLSLFMFIGSYFKSND